MRASGGEFEDINGSTTVNPNGVTIYKPSANANIRPMPCGTPAANKTQIPNFKMEDGAKPRDLEDRTFRFAESVQAFVKQLPRTVSNTEDGRQLVRSLRIGSKRMKR